MEAPATEVELLGEDIRRQSGVLADGRKTWQPLLTEAVERIGDKPSRIYLVGCGDSLGIGNAVRFAWERVLDIPVMSVPAMTFTRYEISNLPLNALVISISQSGKVTRVVEAMRETLRRGIMTLSVTNSATSPLGQEPVNGAIITSYPKLGFVPGTTSYVYYMALCLDLLVVLATRWQGADARTDRIRVQLEMLPELIERSLPAIWTAGAEHAQVLADKRPLVTLGSGPNLANAQFLARKMFEVTQVLTMAQETEEYAHDQYSIVDRRFSAFQFMPVDRGWSRSVEILQSLMSLGTPTAVVVEKGSMRTWAPRPDWIYELAPGMDEFCNAPLFALPAQVFTYELAKRVGASFYAFDDPVHWRDGDALIYDSSFLD